MSRDDNLTAVQTAVGKGGGVLSAELVHETGLTSGEVLTCLAVLESQGKVESHWQEYDGERRKLYYPGEAIDQ